MSSCGCAVPPCPGRQNLLIAGALDIGLVVPGGMVVNGLLGSLWSEFRSAPLFSEDRVDEPWFYF
ncbi:MAG: hypothetical protein R3D25_10105 [Geminicoccaceae bacterium]